VVAGSCSSLAPNLDEAIAIDVVVPDSGRFELGDTLRLSAVALNGRGDTVSATITWSALDSTLQVDSTTGAVVGTLAGSGRVEAHAGTLRSNPITLLVLPPIDSAKAINIGPDSIALSTQDSLSDSLEVQIFVTPFSQVNAQGRLVVWTDTVYSAGGTTITFAGGDTVPTNASGIAVNQLRYGGGPVPDSIVVTATARRALGGPVPPVRFLVLFK